MPNTNALMGMARVLKPFWRFEYWYDRVGDTPSNGSTPIHLGPVNPTIPANGDPPEVDRFALDEAVRNQEQGYAPNLAAMLPVPQIGSDILLYIPEVPGILKTSEEPPDHCYIFVPVWRMRTIRDWNTYKKQGHIHKESFGARDSNLNEDRYILPAATGCCLASNPLLDMPPSGDNDPLVLNNVITDGIVTRAIWRKESPKGPSAAINELALQQGILDMSSSDVAGNPTYRAHWLKVAGDEFAMWVYKAKYPIVGDTTVQFVDWDFQYDPATGFCADDAADIYFSSIFGVGSDPDVSTNTIGYYPFTGLYVMAGKGS